MDTPEAGDPPEAAGATGGDNVQHGDQSAPDAPGAAETQDTRIAYPVSRDWGRRQRKPGEQDSREAGQHHAVRPSRPLTHRTTAPTRRGRIGRRCLLLRVFETRWVRIDSETTVDRSHRLMIGGKMGP